MKLAFRQSGLFRLTRDAVALAAACASGSVMAITVSYSGFGAVTGPAQSLPMLTGLTMTSASSTYTFDTDGSWGVDKVFSFNAATGMGGGTFAFSNGTSGLAGTFTSSRAGPTAPTALTYTVSSGTGDFAGYVGSGFGFGLTSGSPLSLPGGPVSFTEGGFFNVSPVPEPASALLMLSGLGCTLLMRRKPGAH